MAETTLDRMALGGIYDQIGGGFARYSVDERWLVPHFEKMLYDQALLVPVYADAWRVTRKPLYRRVVEETLDFARRAGIAIYTVGLNIPRTDSEVRKVLKKLAEETGGRNFFIQETTELEAIYAAIQVELRSRYLLAYQSTNSSRELRFRLVDLELGRSGLDAKTIRGYYP